MKLRRFLGLDWDAIAGIVAALAALVLHFLHIVEAQALVTLILVMLALLLVRDLRKESEQAVVRERIERMEAGVAKIEAGLHPPDVALIGPRQLRTASAQFARRASGEMLWFNVCLLMFKPQPLFDSLLLPAIENLRVTSIQFVLHEDQRELWTREVMPKVNACGGRNKVREPVWCRVNEAISFILAETEPGARAEALLSFWGEPFMAHSTERDVPRYLFHVQAHSELVSRLGELERSYRLGK
jgi:hypothetical protein